MVVSPLVGFGAQLPVHARRALGVPAGERGPGQPRLPVGADRLGGDHVVRARHAGRAEDDGRHRADPGRVGPPRRERRHPALGHPGRRRGDRGSAPTPAAGASCARSAGGSSRSPRRAASRAQTVASGVMLATAHYGLPVSTTHVISSSVMGVGATRRFSAVRWGVAGNIVVRLDTDDPGRRRGGRADVADPAPDAGLNRTDVSPGRSCADGVEVGVGDDRRSPGSRRSPARPGRRRSAARRPAPARHRAASARWAARRRRRRRSAGPSSRTPIRSESARTVQAGRGEQCRRRRAEPVGPRAGQHRAAGRLTDGAAPRRRPRPGRRAAGRPAARSPRPHRCRAEAARACRCCASRGPAARRCRRAPRGSCAARRAACRAATARPAVTADRRAPVRRRGRARR